MPRAKPRVIFFSFFCVFFRHSRALVSPPRPSLFSHSLDRFSGGASRPSSSATGLSRELSGHEMFVSCKNAAKTYLAIVPPPSPPPQPRARWRASLELYTAGHGVAPPAGVHEKTELFFASRYAFCSRRGSENEARGGRRKLRCEGGRGRGG